jgi:histidinol dehydrogenase
MGYRVYSYPRDRRLVESAFAQSESKTDDTADLVRDIIRAVRERGDDAVSELTEKFDGAKIPAGKTKLDPKLAEKAWKSLPEPLSEALTFAADNIRAFHDKQMRKGFVLKKGGVVLEQRLRPLRRVGCYVPGGAATYPSTVLMNVIPAQVAGVKEIVLATPPIKGEPEAFVPLAVAHMLGVGDQVYQMGGAQAVAALAYGTKSLTRVDKVVGPGNEFVAAAKRQLYGVIDIDSVAGNSEVMVIADESARPDFVAADLIAQAEHTGRETCVLIGIGPHYDFKAVFVELDRLLNRAPRSAQARKSLESGGIFVRVRNRDEAAELANLKAPEHLEIMTETPAELADLIDHVGAIFLGPFTPEPVGDYVAGPNHVLPTGGTARFSSPLGVDAFLKASNVLSYGEAALAKAGPHIVALAESEGLPGHAEAIRMRLPNLR